MMITYSRLHELFILDEEAGYFIRRITTGVNGGPHKAGSIANGSNRGGYRRIKIDGRMYGVHRLIWLYVTGKNPTADIDHINGDRSDNRPCNLREATRSENMGNQRLPHAGNTGGFLGVTFHKRMGKWQAEISVNKKRKFLGTFDSPQAASAAYLSAKAVMHPFAPSNAGVT